jgi:hypothetical protein
MWITNVATDQMTLRKSKAAKGQCYRVSTAHQLHRNLMESYGFAPKERKKKTDDTEGQDGRELLSDCKKEDNKFDEAILGDTKKLT